MGLAGPRKRRKIGEDPNNTTWANDTSSYGQRMLAAQGWTPGTFLGATNAPHASHYTAANASHIRILLKDDNLGLGAQRGKAEGQNFGLLGFNDLLGRLNGKDEKVIEEQQRKRVQIGQMLYAQQKWGGTRFVSGGFLVGDRIEEGVPGKEKVVGAREVNLGHTENGRNVEGTEEKDVEVGKELVEEAKKEAKKRRSAEEKAQRKMVKAARKEEKSKAKASKTNSSSSTDVEDDAAATSATTSANEKGSRKETKEERRQRKAERRARKEEKRRKRAAKSSGETSSVATPTVTSAAPSGLATPALPSDTSGRSTPVLGAGLSVRQRYIKQKRMASMDPQALREILMLKS